MFCKIFAVQRRESRPFSLIHAREAQKAQKAQKGQKGQKGQCNRQFAKQEFDEKFIDKHKQLLWQMYNNTVCGPLDFVVLGDDSLRVGKQELQNLGSLNSADQTGAILNTTKWWHLTNDAFALGFAHAAKRVHVALDSTQLEKKYMG